MSENDNWVYLAERDILIAYVNFTEYPSENNFTIENQGVKQC
jgi:hypothetical protein